MTVELTLPDWFVGWKFLGWAACSLVMVVFVGALIRKYEPPRDGFFEKVMTAMCLLVVGASGPIGVAMLLFLATLFTIGSILSPRKK